MRVTLKTSLIAVLSLLVVIIAGEGWYGITQVDKINSSTQDIAANWMPSVKSLAEIKYLTTRIRLDAVRVAAADYESRQNYIKVLNGRLSEMERAGRQYDKLISGPDERKIWMAFSEKWPVYLKLQQEALSMERDRLGNLFSEKNSTAYIEALKPLDEDIAFNDNGSKAGDQCSPNDLRQRPALDDRSGGLRHPDRPCGHRLCGPAPRRAAAEAQRRPAGHGQWQCQRRNPRRFAQRRNRRYCQDGDRHPQECRERGVGESGRSRSRDVGPRRRSASPK